MLDNIKNCLKISFQGSVSFIICDAGSSYAQIMEQASEHFNVAAEQRSALLLTNGHGYVFEQQLLEYFLLLFPSPEIVFYMRLDWIKLRRAATANASANSSPKRRREEEPEEEREEEQVESSYVAAPVRRQNCFLGAIPQALRQRQQQQQQLRTAASSTSTAAAAAAAAVALTRAQSSDAAPAAKRMRLRLTREALQPIRSDPVMATTPTPSYNRSLRI